MKNPKSKGNTFERLIAQKLSVFLTGEEYNVWRSDSSGAHSTILLRKNKGGSHAKKNVGDLVPTAERGEHKKLDYFFDQYVVELKHYKNIDFYPPYNKVLIDWFEEMLIEKENTGKKCILICKANNRKILIFFENENFPITLYLTIYWKSLAMNGYLFDDFLNNKEIINAF